MPDALPRRRYTFKRKGVTNEGVIDSVEAAGEGSYAGLVVLVRYEDDAGEHEFGELVSW